MGACIGGMCAGLCCSVCDGCQGQKFGVISRIPYIFLFFLAGIFSIIMSLYGTEALDLQFYTTSICNSSTCSGNGAVYRVSFMLFIFEMLHVLIIGAGAISFHWLWFCVKFIIFAACLTLTFVVGDNETSNAFFQGYADYFARFISAFFLILQILILIAYGHKINEFLQEKGNESNVEKGKEDNVSVDTDTRNNSCNKYFMTLAIVTIVLYVISFVLCGLFFKWYAPAKSCTLHKTFISVTIIMILINFTISAVRGDGSLFVSAIVSFYVTFLCLAAMQATVYDSCNVFAGYRGSGSLWIGFTILFFTIFYAALYADRIGVLWEKEEDEYILMSSGGNIDMSVSDKFDKKSIKTQRKKREAKNENKNDNDDILVDHEISVQSNEEEEIHDKTSIPSKKTQRISNMYFHFVLALASAYFAMLLTDWGTGEEITAHGKESMWVNIATQYTTAALFWWTLLAPVICPSRFRQNDEDSV